jgi:hypothetical protein
MKENVMTELERLLPTFKTEIAKIYAEAMHSGIIPSRRREHVLDETARLRAKYNQKIMDLRTSQPARAVDDVEHAIMRTENEFAATLAA